MSEVISPLLSGNSHLLPNSNFTYNGKRLVICHPEEDGAMATPEAIGPFSDYDSAQKWLVENHVQGFCKHYIADYIEYK